jgi:hypothetical protein
MVVRGAVRDMLRAVRIGVSGGLGAVARPLGGAVVRARTFLRSATAAATTGAATPNDRRPAHGRQPDATRDARRTPPRGTHRAGPCPASGPCSAGLSVSVGGVKRLVGGHLPAVRRSHCTPAKRPTAGPRQLCVGAHLNDLSRPPTRATWRRRSRAPQCWSEEGTGPVADDVVGVGAERRCQRARGNRGTALDQAPVRAGCRVPYRAQCARRTAPDASPVYRGRSSRPLQRSSRDPAARSIATPCGAHSGGRSAAVFAGERTCQRPWFLPSGAHEISHWRRLSGQGPPRSCPLPGEAEAVGRRGDGARIRLVWARFRRTRAAIKASLAASARGVL